MTPAEIAAVAAEFEGATPEAVLRWAAERFRNRIGFATAFGPEGCVLLDVIGREKLAIDMFTLDTGLLFPETVQLWRQIEERYGIRVRGVRPSLTLSEQEVQHGPALWQHAPDLCCEVRKVQPLRTELLLFDAWITAIRREQTPERAAAAVVERDARFGLVKVNPLAGWSSAEVWSRIHERAIPSNALHARGYPSIGCVPCTTPVREGEDPRAGRWRTFAKTECGLHRRLNAKSPKES
ncbi:MAG TPA: phosphoadenylyl-sulfate reductase [Myxococcales bacterium]|nr:phosphoadenylyl-sulfate reductase [Myxococcales bacterium]